VRAVAVITGVLVAAVLAGCGTGGRERDVRGIAERFASAVGNRDGAAACALLTSDARAQLESDQGEPCRKAVVKLNVSGPKVNRVSVFVTSASADFAGGGTVFLDQTTHGWRVSSAGCKPQPDDRPYDCELQV
jgi:hypothetical protein